MCLVSQHFSFFHLLFYGLSLDFLFTSLGYFSISFFPLEILKGVGFDLSSSAADGGRDVVFMCKLFVCVHDSVTAKGRAASVCFPALVYADVLCLCDYASRHRQYPVSCVRSGYPALSSGRADVTGIQHMLAM